MGHGHIYQGPPSKQLKSQIWPNVMWTHLQRSTLKTIEKSILSLKTAAIVRLCLFLKCLPDKCFLCIFSCKSAKYIFIFLFLLVIFYVFLISKLSLCFFLLLDYVHAFMYLFSYAFLVFSKFSGFCWS